MKKVVLLVLILCLFAITGCRKPYKEDKFVTISPSQTAFLIPLDGNTKDNQASFDSIEFLTSAKVATKRIQIRQQWHQTGRRGWVGRYINSERLIIVERKPETREWTANTDGTSTKNQGIETESNGSIGFIIGIGITAQIDESDAVKFLYRYNNKPLASIMDEEIRSMVESKFNEECSKLELSVIIGSKAKILDNVKSVILPYFKERGISITNIGYKGQFTYVDSKIQDSINKEFIAEKDRVAQEKINEMNVEKARKQAEAQRIAQEERNKMEIAKAEAEARAIELRAKTLESQIKMKELEIKEKWIDKWDGRVPTYQSGADDNLMLKL